MGGFQKRSRGRALAPLAALLVLTVLWLAPAAPAAEPVPLEKILERAARHAGQFVQQFSDVKCTERVLQAKLGKNDKVEYKDESVFDYLLMLRETDGDIQIDESRLAVAEIRLRRNLPLLVTNGFSTLLLIFHPVYQSSFDFTRLDDELLDGRLVAPVRFRHIRGTRSPAALLLRGREYPLDLEGTAWVDPDSGAVVKLSLGLHSSMDDVGLRAFRSEVRYVPVQFTGSEHSFWLPQTATVDVETPRQHWRNTHRFTEYKLFSVSATSSIASQP